MSQQGTRKICGRGVGVLLALLVLSPGAQASAPILTLPEAVRYALEHSPGYDSARKTQSVRALEYKSSFAKLLPSVDLSTTDGLQNNIPIASTSGTTSIFTSNPSAPWYSALNLGVTETLYDNGVSLTGLGVADLSRELSEVSLLKSRDTLTLEIASEFYRYSLAKGLLEVRQQQQALLARQFKTMDGQYRQGFKTKGDFMRLKTQVQRAEIDQITAENTVQQAVAELQKLLGVRIGDAEPPLFAALVVKPEQRLEAQFPTGRPDSRSFYDFRIRGLQDELNGKTVELARRRYLPQLSLTSGVAYSNQSFLNSQTPFAAGHQLSWNALVTLQYNIWDWGTRRRDVEVADLNRGIQANTLDQGLLEVNARITALMADLTRISRSYQLSQELMALEAQSNQDLQSQYREGKATYLDLITSLNSLLDARVQFYTSYFDSLRAIAQYRYFEGKIYESLVAEK
jgi:outer membrane protein